MSTLSFKYVQYRGVTAVSMINGKMQGLSVVRPGDTFNRDLGVAIALAKAGKRIPACERHHIDKIPDDFRIKRLKSVKITQKDLVAIILAQQVYRNEIGQNYEYFAGRVDAQAKSFSKGKPIAGFTNGERFSFPVEEVEVFLKQNRTPHDPLDAEVIGRALLKNLDCLGK